MTVKTERHAYRLSLSVLAALSIAACSDNSSPTGVSPLPSAAALQPASAVNNVNANPLPESQEGAEGVETVVGPNDCAAFNDVRLRVFARDTDVVVQYAVDARTEGFYWVRFWPEGRHNSEPIDHLIGQLAAGESTSGEFVAMSFGDIDRKVTLHYNVDVDVSTDRDGYENGITINQCDRGGELSIEPPPEPPECGERSLSIEKMKMTRINYGNVRVYAYASASNFTGTVELEWQGMGHSELVASAALDAECADESVELSWETDRSWARHATFIVRVLNDKGRVVDSKTCIGGDLKNGDPDSFSLTCN